MYASKARYTREGCEDNSKRAKPGNPARRRRERRVTASARFRRRAEHLLRSVRTIHCDMLFFILGQKTIERREPPPCKMTAAPGLSTEYNK